MNGADRINEPDLARIRSLIDRIGWPMARDLVVAVSSIDRRDLLHHMTHREAATVKVALAVMAGDG